MLDLDEALRISHEVANSTKESPPKNGGLSLDMMLDIAKATAADAPPEAMALMTVPDELRAPWGKAQHQQAVEELRGTRDWGVMDPLREGAADIVRGLAPDQSTTAYLDWLQEQATSDETFRRALDAGQVRGADMGLMMLSPQERIAAIGRELAWRERVAGGLEGAADAIAPTPHAAPEGLLENMAYKGLGLLPGVAKMAAELFLLKRAPIPTTGGFTALNTIRGANAAREQVFQNARAQGADVPEAIAAAEAPAGMAADIAARAAANIATMGALGKAPVLGDTLSPLVQTMRNIALGAAASGAGEAASSAITDVRSGQDVDAGKALKAGAEAAATTALYGGASALARGKQLMRQQRADRALKEHVGRHNAAVTKRGFSPVNKDFSLQDSGEQIANAVKGGMMTRADARAMLLEAGYPDEMVTRILQGMGREARLGGNGAGVRGQGERTPQTPILPENAETHQPRAIPLHAPSTPPEEAMPMPAPQQEPPRQLTLDEALKIAEETAGGEAAQNIPEQPSEAGGAPVIETEPVEPEQVRPEQTQTSQGQFKPNLPEGVRVFDDETQDPEERAILDSPPKWAQVQKGPGYGDNWSWEEAMVVPLDGGARHLRYMADAPQHMGGDGLYIRITKGLDKAEGENAIYIHIPHVKEKGIKDVPTLLDYITKNIPPEAVGLTSSPLSQNEEDFSSLVEVDVPKQSNTARVRTAAGTEIETRYRVVSAGELNASHTEAGALNAGYPQELQPRQRDREASLRQVDKIANELDPTLLGENRMASDGAPIIGPDGVVESGNGRVMALRKAYRTGKAGGYAAWLRENAAKFGLSEADIDAVQDPVLVRERTSDVDRVKFVNEANQSTVARMSRTEQAMADAKRMTPDMVAGFDPEQSVRGNRDFVETFAREIVGDNERGAFLQADGRLSQEGEQRIVNALFAFAYGDTVSLNRLRETLDDDTKNVSSALVSVAGRMAAMETGIQQGALREDLSLRKDLAQAANMLAQIRLDGGTVEAFLAQRTMFADAEISPEAKKLLEFFDKNKRSAKRMREALGRYADLVEAEGSPAQVSMFDEEESPRRTKADLLEEALRDEAPARPQALPRETIKQRVRQQVEELRNEKLDDEVGEATAELVVTLMESEAKSRGISVEDVAREWKLDIVDDPEGRGMVLFTGDKDLDVLLQRMYHGTRHTIEGKRFKLKKIGTGEGAQVYGWGGYLSETDDVAGDYRTAGNKAADMAFVGKDGRRYAHDAKTETWTDGKEALSKSLSLKLSLFATEANMSTYDGMSPKEKLTAILEHEQKILERQKAKGTVSADWIAAEENDLQWIRDNIEEIGARSSGYLYTFEGPENDVLLDWDAPLGRQPEKVKKAIDKAKKELGVKGLTGGAIYRALSDALGGDKAASLWLKKQGVLGHRYLDQKSRAAGKGTRNFVIWDEKALKMLGVEGPAADVVETYRQSGRGAGLEPAPRVTEYDSIEKVIDVINTKDGRKKASSARVTFAKVTESVSEAIRKQTGENIGTDFTHVIDGGDIFHILKEHGEGQEKLEHQSPVTEEDIKMLPDIVTHPDKIGKGGKTRQGLDTIAFAKKVDGHILVVEAIRSPNRKKNLAVTSIRKVDAGYEIDFSSPELLGKKQKAGSQRLTSDNGSQVLAERPNAPDLNSSISQSQGTDQVDADARGYTQFVPEITDAEGNVIQEAQTIIGILKNADKSTLVHELGHVFLERMKRMAQMEGIPQDVKDDWKVLVDWLRLRDIDFSKPLSEKEQEVYHNAQEKFASGWEKYFATGKAPNKRLQRIFDKFKQWMKEIYKAVKNIVWRGKDGKEHKFDLPQDVRRVMDRMLTPEERMPPSKSVGDLAKEAGERINEKLPPREDPRNLGAVAPGYRPEIDPETNPQVRTAEPPPKSGLRFQSEETEERYSAAKEGVAPEGRIQRTVRAVRDFVQGLKGDFPMLAGKREMIPARETLRRLNREKGVAAQNAVTTLRDALHGMSPRDFDLFARKRLLDDLTWRKKQLPDAELPFGFTEESLREEHARYTKLTEGNERVKRAIEAEEKAIRAINERMVELAEKLGWTQLKERFKNPHYFRHQVLDFAKMLDRGYLKRFKGSKRDINANYIQANGEVRAVQMQDIAMLEALVELKEGYDIGDRLRAEAKEQGKKLKDVVPEGYTRWSPFGRGILPSVESLTEQALDAALADGGRQLGLGLDDMLDMMDDAQDAAYKSRMWVIPVELAETLNKMGAKKERMPLLKAVREVTSGWKSWVLYSPTRVLQYNIRNVTGDMDAFIAGNPRGAMFIGQAMRDLTDLYFRGRAAEGELHEFQQRGGALTSESVQELYDWRQMREFAHLMDQMEGADMAAWRRLGRQAWGLVDGYWRGAERLTDFREQILRYATYLSYLDQIRNSPDGKPANWGASSPDEVMAVKDMRDRAFKMANELLGAYDQVSQTGQQMRDIAMPFYSWLEVNAKRYYNLLKNGFSSDTPGDFAARLLKGQVIKSPLYAYRAAKTILMVNLFSWAIQAFNQYVMGDEEDELPPDVQDRPHITLGRTPDGRVLYFDRIGATMDVLDWFSLDSFWPDVRDILNGQQTVTGYLKKMASAPFSKAMNAVNPMIKMPYELAMGRSTYPDMGNPRMIRDVGTYIASSLGLSWEYRAATGAPGPKYFSWDRLRGLFTYSADAKEGAYFYILDRKREFQERVLGRSFDGGATSRRGNALRRLKTSIRFKDQANIERSLQEYVAVGGTRRGLKSSLEAMSPLHGLNKEEQRQFYNWLSEKERDVFKRAVKYYQDMRGAIGR